MTPYITMFVMLVGAHAIGDYALQSEYIAREKTRDLYVLFIHATIWTFTVAMTGYVIGLPINLVHILFILWVPHFVMDYLKAQSKWFPSVVPDPKKQLTIDQAVHYFQLLVLLVVTTQSSLF